MASESPPPPPTPPPKDEEEAKPVSSAASSTTKPTLQDRYNQLSLFIFPREFYLHPALTRERLFPSLLFLLLLLLLLTILLPSILLSHHRTHAVGFPTSGTTFSGDGTYYAPGLGACGIVSGEQDMVVAIGWQLFDATTSAGNPNANPVCGRKIVARREGAGVDAGKTVEVMVVDRCVGCESGDLDFSLAAFEKIAEEAEGRVKVAWAWA